MRGKSRASVYVRIESELRLRSIATAHANITSPCMENQVRPDSVERSGEAFHKSELDVMRRFANALLRQDFGHVARQLA